MMIIKFCRVDLPIMKMVTTATTQNADTEQESLTEGKITPAANVTISLKRKLINQIVSITKVLSVNLCS